MNSAVFIQSGYTDFSLNLLWIGSLILFVITCILFVTSIIGRVRNELYERKLQQKKDDLFPYVMEFLEGTFRREQFSDLFSGNSIEYLAFENIIFELLENIEGEEVDKLQRLLTLSEIYDYHCDQLDSRFTYTRMKACSYFSYIKLVNREIIEKIRQDLHHSNQLLAFSAASALMASDEVKFRAEALEAVVVRKRVSGMAILEMLYKFHNTETDQMDEESDYLHTLILTEEAPPENIAVIIRGVSEIGYHGLAPLLNLKLYSNEKRWNHTGVLSALIEALGNFYYDEASPGIRVHIYHPSPLVRRACVIALGKLSTDENLRAVYNMLYDDNFTIKYLAVKALKEAGDTGEAWLEYSQVMEEMDIKPIVKTIEE